MTPRCGREMTPYEKVWGALLDPVLCGRPEGHTGMHRSVQSLNKARERDRLHWPAARARRRRKRRQEREELLRDQLAAAVNEASARARERVTGRGLG